MSQGLWVIFVDCDNFEIYFETFDDSFNSVGFVQLEIISILSSLVDFQVPFTITSSNEFWTSNESGPRGVNLREFFKCLFQEKYGSSDKDENKDDPFQFRRWKIILSRYEWIIELVWADVKVLRTKSDEEKAGI